MPRQNGFETLKSIKNDAYLKHTHVIIYSTSGAEEEIDECYKLGAKFYIRKPISLVAMTNILDQMFVGLGKPKNQIGGIDKFVLRDRKKQL
jgi:two-component system response regulator